MLAGVLFLWFLVVASPAFFSPPRLSWFHSGRLIFQLSPPSSLTNRPPGIVPAYSLPGWLAWPNAMFQILYTLALAYSGRADGEAGSKSGVGRYLTI